MKKFIFILLVAGMLVSTGLTVHSLGSKKAQEKAQEKAQIQAKVYYQCTMHPEIIQDKPGNCPICGMILTRVDSSKVTPAGLTTTAGTAAKNRKIIFYRSPMNPEVTSPGPAKDEMGMDYLPVYEDLVPPEEVLQGRAPFDLSREQQELIGVRTEPASVRSIFLTIETVGEIAYDPELFEALEEYRQAKGSYDDILKNRRAGKATRKNYKAVMGAARTRLKVLGVDDDLLQEYLKTPEGDESLLHGGNRPFVWVYAQIYENELSVVKPGQTVEVEDPTVPGRTAKGTIKAIDSVLNPNTRTARARALIRNRDGSLKPQMSVRAVIRVEQGKRLAVPSDSILYTGTEQFVFVEKWAGHFEPRKIQTGAVGDDAVEVIRGVSQGEKIVTGANFLIDSESRFRGAAEKQVKSKK